MIDAARTTTLNGPSPGYRQPDDDLLLRETNHRCSNDLQMVVSLLGLQSSRAKSHETRQALIDAMERVSVLARSRAALQHQKHLTLGAALRQVCEALHAQAEPRSILITCEISDENYSLSPTQVMTLALTVNELTTNAIKHAFEQGKSGRIRISAREDNRNLTVIVDDDGLPFPDSSGGKSDGLGLGLVKRLVASIGGPLILPVNGSKCFEIRMPVSSQ